MGYCLVSKHLSTNYFLVTKRNPQVGKSGRQHVTRITSINNAALTGHDGNSVTSATPAGEAQSESICEETSDSDRRTSDKIRSVIFKSVKTLKAKGRLRSHSGLKETQEA